MRACLGQLSFLRFSGALFIVVFGLFCRAEEKVELSYSEKPPFYYTHDNSNTPDGFLLKKVVHYFELAKIPYLLLLLPPKRMLQKLEESETQAACGIGWFKNPEREKIAKFTLAIHTDDPFVVVTRKSIKQKLLAFKKIEQLLLSDKFTPVLLDGVSYGTKFDNLLKLRPTPPMKNTVDFQTVFQMVQLERAHYTLAEPHEFDYFSKLIGKHDLVAVHFSDIPKGNSRYIMCTRSTPDSIIEKLNQQINKN